MIYYVITHPPNNLVGVTPQSPYELNLPGVSVHEMDGDIPDLNTHIWDFSIDNFVKADTKLTQFVFLSRFSLAERINIRSSTDPVVLDIMVMLEAVEYIDTQHPDTIQGVSYLASVGLISPSRVSEILT